MRLDPTQKAVAKEIAQNPLPVKDAGPFLTQTLSELRTLGIVSVKNNTYTISEEVKPYLPSLTK